MSWAHYSWLWTIEPVVLIILLSVLVKIVAFNYRQVELLTEEMYTSVVRAQTFLQHVDREFEVMNTCAKSVKSIFLNFGRVYREIAEGGKSVDETIKIAKKDIPEELRSNFSDFFNLANDESVTSLETEAAEKSGPVESSSLDIDFPVTSITKAVSTDTEDSSCRLYVPKNNAKHVISSTILTRSEVPTDSSPHQ